MYSPRWRSLPDIAHHAFERFGAVLERTHAAVPEAVVGGGLRLPFRPSKSKTNRENITSRTVEMSDTLISSYPRKESRFPPNRSGVLMVCYFRFVKQSVRHGGHSVASFSFTRTQPNGLRLSPRLCWSHGRGSFSLFVFTSSDFSCLPCFGKFTRSVEGTTASRA